MVPLCSAQPAQLDLAAVEHRGQRHRGGESLWWVQVTLIKVGGVAWWLSGRRSGVRKECRVWQRGSRKEKWGLMTPHSVVLLSFKAEDLPLWDMHFPSSSHPSSPTLQLDQTLAFQVRLSYLGPGGRSPG